MHKKQLIAIVALIIALGSGGIMLAAEGKDAVTIAAEQKTGLWASEQVNVSFQSVSGKLTNIL